MTDLFFLKRMSRAHHASIGIFKKMFYTFDFENNYHISLADNLLLNINTISRELKENSNILHVGPITFNLETSTAIFKGCRLDSTSWVASEYADSLIINDIPASRDEIIYLVKSLIHLLISN
jgi:hypothetical protein